MEDIHFRKVKNSEYLGSCDLKRGEELNAVIKGVIIKQATDANGKKNDCNVAYFTDDKIKPMILNSTNAKIIKGFTPTNTPYINEWVNIPVTIYIDYNIRVGKNVVDGLRIKPIQPKKALPQAKDEQISASVEAIKAGKKEKQPVIDWYKKNTIISDEQLTKLQKA